MTEILLLGTFHFLESNLDFYSYETQRQLQILTDGLAKFSPDKISIEAAINSQKAVDESYNKFSLHDLNNHEKMKSETLGTIEMFGDTYPITYNNEAIQIAYRLGKMLNKERIYAIDDDTELDMSVMEKATDNLKQLMNNFHKDMENNNKGSILDLYSYYNSFDWSLQNHRIYLSINNINTSNSYDGSLYVSKWYERNLKIFSNMQELCKDCERLFVIYGAGHLHILRDFIKESENLKLVDVYKYL